MKSRSIAIWAFPLVALLSSRALAAPLNVDNVHIERILVRSDGQVFVKLDIPLPPSATYTACSVNTEFHITFNANSVTGQALLATATTGYVSQRPMRIWGSGTCPTLDAPAVEGTYFLELKQ
jgi:hypothetical protein